MSPSPSPRKVTFEGRDYTFPHDATDEEIGNILGNPSPSHGILQPPEGIMHQIGRQVVGSLPAIGATAGGVLGASLGGFGAVGGAAVGAGTGEATRQLVGSWFPGLAQAPKSNQEAVTETAKQMAIGGATEAGAPWIGKAFQWLGGPLKKSAAKGLISVMAPEGKQAEADAMRAAPGLLEKGPGSYMAVTRGQLERRATGKAAEAGAAIGSMESSPLVANRQIQMAPVIKGLDDYEKTLYMPPVGQPGGALTTELRYGAEPKKAALDRIRQQLSDATSSGDISRESMRMVRQDLDSAVQQAKGFSKLTMARGSVADAELAARTEVEEHQAGALRKVLNQDRPDIAKLNAEFSLWDNVKDAMRPASVSSEIPNQPPSAWSSIWHAKHMAWLAGAGLGYGARGIEGAEAVGAMFAVSTLMKTTAWRTLSAATKNSMADMLAAHQFEEVAKFATRIAAQRNIKLPPPQPGQQQEQPQQ